MKLRARIERKTVGNGKCVTLTYARGVQARTPEAIIARNLGPRPWTELSFWRDGQAVHRFAK